MTSKEHHKHPKLPRPALGQFGRNEWAVLGTTCEVIQQLAATLFSALSSQYAGAYVDTSHQAINNQTTLPGMLQDGAIWAFTDLIQARQLQSTRPTGPFQIRQWLNDADMILVNGNHHQAARQVIVLDTQKRHSLEKRLPQLTDVRLILEKDASVLDFTFLESAIPELKKIPVLSLNDLPAILRFFETVLQQERPPLKGLVLAGGKSLRMGQDKGRLTWHGIPQRERLAALLSELCHEVLFSVRADQKSEFQADITFVEDTFLELGPYGALLSAFRSDPNAAWLVVACDLPLIDKPTLEYLITQRMTQKIATAFRSPFDGMPEPLVAIWEPKSYASLLAFLSQGYSCPRKVLMNTDTHLIDPPAAEALTNVNTPEEVADLLARYPFLQAK